MSVRLAELIGNAHAFETLEDFRRGIPVLLREFVPADTASYNEMDEDPDGSWWTSDPFIPLTPELEKTFAELAGQNPILAHNRSTRDGRPRRSVSALEGLGLTRRQAEALRWIALGRRGPAIAKLMGLSPRTVEKHLQLVYEKLGASGPSEAAATAWAAVGVRLP